MAERGIADILAEEAMDTLESLAEDLAAAVLGSVYAPDVVEPTRAEALAYWRAQLVNPDGTPNAAGRARAMARLGPRGYEQVALAVAGAPAAPPNVPREV